MLKINRLLTWPILLLFLVSSTALAATTPPDPASDAAEWAKALYAAFTSHNWTVLTGLVLVGVVYALRRWALAWVPWFKTPFGGVVLAFTVSLAGTLGSASAAGAHLSLSLAAGALATAATAAGLWEWAKAHIPGMQEAADKATLPTARVVS